MKKFYNIFLFALIAIMMPIGAWAQTSTIDLSTLTATYVISDSEEYTFTGTGSYGIKVESGNPTIVLDNANITVGEGSAIDVASGSNATIFVLGDNTIDTIDSWNDVPSGGIFVAEGGTVNITSNGTNNILRAHGTLAAAIGGKYVYVGESYNAGNINISNVTVYAYTNNYYAAAIGAAGRGSCGTINITNAVVYAYGAGDRWTSAPGIGSACDHVGWAETIPVVIISGSEIHTFRYNPYSDYIGYLGDEMGEEGGYHATGSINCGEGGSVKSSTIYCYTGLTATTTDKTVKYGALGGLLKEDGTCEGEHSGGTATCTTLAVCENCGASYGERGNHSTAAEGDRAATCKELAYCSVCQKNYGEVDSTNHASTEFTYTANEDGTTHKKAHKCCDATAAETEAHTLDVTTGKCGACGADMTVVATVTDGTNTYYAADAATLNQAVTAILETGSRTFTVELPADTEAGMITAIRRAICDTEGVADGSIHLTLKGVTSIPGTTNWDGVAFGPRNAQWDENNIEIVSHEEVTQLASVNLPDVTEIGAQAFYFCENLVTVSAPKAQTIGAQALGYTALTSVEFPELTTIPTDMFSGTWTLSSAKFPKVTTIEQGGLLVGAKFAPENNPTPFPLELTAEGDITFNGSNHFNIKSQNYSGKVDLVLCCDKADKVTKNEDGTATWQVRDDLSYTFKSITLAHTPVADDGDCTTAVKCATCGETVVEAKESHTTELAENKATCQNKAKCDLCGTEYGEKDTNNHTGTLGTPVPTEDDTQHIATWSCCEATVTEEHTPDESYTANGNVIMVSCSECHGTAGTATIIAENTTYNGTAQETATVAYSEGWNSGELTVSYANNTNAGTATASITVGEATASVEFTIAKAEIDGGTLINPEFAKGLIYNGTAQALVTKTGSVDGGYIVYSLSIDGEYTTTIPVATEAGNYRVYWTIECDENHYVDGTPGSSRVTIAKAASSITTAPSGKELTYKGYAQALVTAGEAMGGTILYSLDNATWNEEIPVGKEIGDYTVYYKVIGDNNYDDIATQSVTVAIKACEHSYNEDGFCEMCSTANPDETMFFIFDGDHKAFNVAEDLVGVNIEYTRGLHNTEWNSIYLPFEVPVTEGLLDEFEFAYVNDMHSADTDDNGEIDEIEMEIVKIKTGTLHANHPYFIRAKSEYTILQLSYENTTLHATKETTLNCSSIYMDYAIVGTYKHIKGTEFASMPADRYYAISIDGGWWQIPEDSSLYPFRAYLSMTARDGSPVKVSDEAMRSIRIREKGEGTTGIEEVKGENGEVKTIYDLQGRRVEVPNKGLYIINGKKVLIK